MAKEIKAIQCPKCGSTQKTEIRPDYFKCQNCGTEYFLDNDDITINHNVNYRYQTPTQAGTVRRPVVIVVAALFCFLLAGIVLSQLFSPARSTSVSSHVPGIDNRENYHWSNRDIIAFENQGGKLVIAIMGHRDYDEDRNQQNTGNYIAFYDALSGQELSKQRLTGMPQNQLSDADFSIFQNGDIYAIANKSLLYKIDKVNTRLVTVPADFFSHHEELAAGIAQMEFRGQEWGDGLKLMTNDGKARIYFPISDKVYTEKSSYTAERALAIKEPGAKTRTYFLFSELSDEFPDEPIKLMMYTQKDNLGGPNTRPFFQKNDYTFLYQKKTVSDFRQGAEYVISYKDFTPGRSYFSPEVLYSDDHFVLITFKATAAGNANVSVQCLSVPDGRIIFTMPFEKGKNLDHVAYRFKDGFVLETYESMYIVNMNGKIVKEFKIMN